MIIIRSLLFLLSINIVQLCPLKTVNLRSGCYCGIEIDGSNYIHCHPSTIDQIPSFTRSYVYEKLNLSRNSLRSLKNYSFEHLKVRRIYLEDNPIVSIDSHTFNAHVLNYLEELYLSSDQRIEPSFLCFGHWNKLRVLKLSGFHFQQAQICLEKFSRLERLILHNCSIDIFLSSIFSLPQLTELTLTSNQLKSLNINAHSSVRLLNLTSNQFNHLSMDLFNRLPSLSMLDLSNNQLKTMNIIHSNHTLINFSSNPLCTFERPRKTELLIFDHLTHLHCDCRLIHFIRNDQTNLSQTIGDHHPFPSDTQCNTPEPFQGRLLKDLTFDEVLQMCSMTLPSDCEEVNNFDQIKTYRNQWIGQIQSQINDISEDHHDSLSSFHLTFFDTIPNNNDLIVRWNFDHHLSHDRSKIHFQILVEQQLFSRTEIIRRIESISPFLKQYTIAHLPDQGNYHVCLLLTRISHGTDKYCRSTDLSSRTISSSSYFTLNRSIFFGFFFGILLTSCCLCLIACLCRLHHRHRSSMSDQQQQQQRYMFVDQDIKSFTSSTLSSKMVHWKSSPHRHFPIRNSLWYQPHVRHFLSTSRASCCCRHSTPPMTSQSSDFSETLEKEVITSTSLMSTSSWDEQQSQSTKHVYEEVTDGSVMLSHLV